MNASSGSVTVLDKIGLGLAAAIYAGGLALVLLPARESAGANAAAWAPAPSVAPAPAVAAPLLADQPQTTPLARHRISFELGPRAGFEFKYRLGKGAAMVYNWSASGPVKFELHGEPDGARPGYADTYRTGEDRAASGLFVAPSTGIHGWYWENAGQAPVTITLKTSGFYTAALELKASGPVEHRIEQ